MNDVLDPLVSEFKTDEAAADYDRWLRAKVQASIDSKLPLVPHDQVMTDAKALAERLCRVAPLAVRTTKEVAVRSREMPWVDAVRFGETMRIVAQATEDAKEGRAAFAEGRQPDWQGR